MRCSVKATLEVEVERADETVLPFRVWCEETALRSPYGDLFWSAEDLAMVGLPVPPEPVRVTVELTPEEADVIVQEWPPSRRPVAEFGQAMVKFADAIREARS